MIPNRAVPDKLIWATRGRSWGFRFLLKGGQLDPLPHYERIFAGLGDDPNAWRRVGGEVALRLADPMGRRDASGRVIPHEFVVEDLAGEIDSVEDGRRKVWPLVDGIYARIWMSEEPPSDADVQTPPPAQIAPDATE